MIKMRIMKTLNIRCSKSCKNMTMNPVPRTWQKINCLKELDNKQPSNWWSIPMTKTSANNWLLKRRHQYQQHSQRRDFSKIKVKTSWRREKLRSRETSQRNLRRKKMCGLEIWIWVKWQETSCLDCLVKRLGNCKDRKTRRRNQNINISKHLNNLMMIKRRTKTKIAHNSAIRNWRMTPKILKIHRYK